MAQFFFLGLEVVFGVGLRFDFAGDAFDDLNSGGFEGSDLVWVIGQQTNLMDAELFEHSRWEFEAAMVGFEA